MSVQSNRNANLNAGVAPALAPVLFISHGAPTFALEAGELGARLRTLGQQLPMKDLHAVLMISPHWQTRTLEITSAVMPETIHDFGGFSPKLYQLRYPAVGDPQLAQAIQQTLAASGQVSSLNPTRGLDHGAWVPLLHLLPAATLPVLQLSLPLSLTPHTAWQLGVALQPLRQQGILVIGSGSMTHNLHEVFGAANNDSADYVSEFVDWMDANLVTRNVPNILAYRQQAPAATRAHPTEEHLLPLMVALGASHDTDPIERLSDEVTYDVISMASYAWGQVN